MHYTPLRYPGGKSRLAPFVKLLFQWNNLLDGHYVEPYAGGAGIALSLLFHECASHVHINDLSKPVYAFWHSAINETEALCTMIEQTPVSVDKWFEQKEIQTRVDTVPCLSWGSPRFS